MSTRTSDALVVFGITGDLARKMTFRALYRLERRGMLGVPVIGIAGDDMTDDQLRQRARESIEQTGEQLDESVFKRFAGRLHYVGGDFSDDQTYARVAQALHDYQDPTFYLEIPPSLFATVVAGLSKAGLVSHGERVVVEKPFGHDLASARQLAADLHQYLDESQIYRIDHFLGKLGLEEILYLRFANTMLEPVWSRNYLSCVQMTMAEQFGVEDRGHFYDPVGALRDVVVNHLFQLLAVAAMEPPSGSDPETLKDTKMAVFKSIADADPGHYVRGQYDGYLNIDGVAPNSTTETYCALRLEIDNWRWGGVPVFIRTGKQLAVTETEIRLIFRRPPRLHFVRELHRHPHPNQIVFKIDPASGIQMRLDAQRAESPGISEIEFDVEFAEELGQTAEPYEVLLHAALIGDSTHFTRQDIVEESWRIVQPLLDSPPSAHPYAKGSWGPAEADGLVTHYGGWRGPWMQDAAGPGSAAKAAG
ncbi:MAG TPA: glucose-6-phosphate dehydrogenase [Solirubrobacteraceae bacterium]|nr:glucose-6-phosphate dehydrogenase [Solirubrobacteraceae bacterium]